MPRPSKPFSFAAHTCLSQDGIKTFRKMLSSPTECLAYAKTKEVFSTLNLLNRSGNNGQKCVETFLMTKGIFWALNAHHPSAPLMGIIKHMPPAHQTNILCTPWAIRILSERGHAATIMEIVQKADQETKIRILSTDCAIYGLAPHGQADAIAEIVRTASPDEQQRMMKSLGGFFPLMDHGYSDMVNEIIRGAKQSETVTPFPPSP